MIQHSEQLPRRTDMNLKALLSDLPPTIQYIAVIGLVMLILYVCLTLTRFFGAKRGEKYDYNDPEKADEMVPDLFASTASGEKRTRPTTF